MHLIHDFTPKIEDNAPPYQQLKYYRELRHLSRSELGELVGVAAGVILNFEKQFNEIREEDAIVLAKALDIDVNLLLDDYSRFTAKGCGERVKEIRNKMQMSQNEFAKFLGVGRATVSIWEIEYNNHRPSRKMYLKLMESLKGINDK